MWKNPKFYHHRWFLESFLIHQVSSISNTSCKCFICKAAKIQFNFVVFEECNISSPLLDLLQHRLQLSEALFWSLECELCQFETHPIWVIGTFNWGQLVSVTLSSVTQMIESSTKDRKQHVGVAVTWATCGFSTILFLICWFKCFWGEGTDILFGLQDLLDILPMKCHN